jgi:hypothetical protein
LLTNPTDTAAAKRALVRTYSLPAYADPWDCVEDFERVQQAAAKHPNKGSVALSSVVDFPAVAFGRGLTAAAPIAIAGYDTTVPSKRNSRGVRPPLNG